MRMTTKLKTVLVMLALAVLYSPAAVHAAKNTKAYSPTDSGVYGRVMDCIPGVGYWGYPTTIENVNASTSPNSPMSVFNGTGTFVNNANNTSTFTYYIYHEHLYTPNTAAASMYGQAARWYYISSWDTSTLFP